jgi:hypothetical protein
MADDTSTAVWVVGRPDEPWCADVFAHLAPIADRLTLRLAPSLAEVPHGALAITRDASARLAGTLGAAEILARPPIELLSTKAAAQPATPRHAPLVVSVIGTDAILGAEVALLVAEGCAIHLATTLVEARARALQGFLHDLVDPPITLESLVAHTSALPASGPPGSIGTPLATRGYRLLPRARHPLGGGYVGFDAAHTLLGSLAEAGGMVVADCDLPGPDSLGTGLVDADELAALPRALLGASAAVILVGRPTLAGHYALVNLCTEVLGLLPKEAQLSCVLVGATRRGAARTLVQLLEEVHPGSTQRLTSTTVVPEPDLDSIHRSVAPIPPAALGPLAPLVKSLAGLQPATATTHIARVDYPIYETLDALLPSPSRPREAS